MKKIITIIVAVAFFVTALSVTAEDDMNTYTMQHSASVYTE